MSAIQHSAYMEIRRFSSICQYLTVKATKTCLHHVSLQARLLKFVILFYLSIWLPTLPSPECSELCHKTIFKAHRCGHVQPLLNALLWLPIQPRIDFKLSTVCHNFFSDASFAKVYL